VRLPLVTVSVCILFTGIVTSVAAQTDAPLSATEVAAACAPPVAPTRAQHTLRVIGVQDVVARTIFDDRDLLVIGGGSRDGLQLGAQFFVRRTSRSGMGGMYGGGAPTDTITDGWIRIVAVNETTAIAQAERVCGSIFANDYLEPFVAPVLPANASGRGGTGDPDFTRLAQVVSGPAGHRTAAIGEFVTLDRGTEQGVQVGAEFAFYRDLTHARPVIRAQSGVPLTAIGEAVVVSVTGSRSLAKIVRSRDAIQTDDYAVLRR
jgi:hypothetical protein